jgi:DeoR/GlpR family transcriptional regulator of sugar metabolism
MAMTKRGRPSLAQQRHEMIVSQVRRSGSVRVADLAEQLDVSEMTVRRDLDALDEAGLVVKVHGGATLRYAHSSDEPGFEAKSLRNTVEKRAIAGSAAVLVGASAAIGITAGTTTALLAAELATLPDLTVVTNSIRVADVFHAAARPDRTVILVGGQRTPSDALVGPVAVAALQRFHLDTVFMGVHGIHPRSGFTTPNLLEAETNAAFVDAAEQLVVLADHTKWDVTGLCTIAPLEAASVVVSDDGLGAEARSILGERVGRLTVSSTGLHLHDHDRSA